MKIFLIFSNKKNRGIKKYNIWKHKYDTENIRRA